jgi:hypothetical protein
MSAPSPDPARRALGEASRRVLAERLESPLGEAERAGGLKGPLGTVHVIEARFEGPVSEALLSISASLGYGLSIDGPAGASIAVVIEPAQEGRTLFKLIKELNRGLKPHGAVIGVDIINRRLGLRGGGRP